MNDFLNKRSLSIGDKSSLVIYSIVSAIVYYIGCSEIIDWRNIVLGYSFGTPMNLYLFRYKALRNLYVFVFWVIISFFHLYLFFVFSGDVKWTTSFGFNEFDRLQFTWMFLLYFQTARFIHLKVKNNELVSAAGASYDLIDDRKIDYLDYILFFTFIVVWVFFS